MGVAVVLVSPCRLLVGCSAATPSMRKNCLAILGEVDIHVAELFSTAQRSTFRFSRMAAFCRVSPNHCWLGAAPPRGVAETVGVLFLLRKLCYCIVSYIFLQEGWHDKYCIGSGKS